ncbi:MAG TPA: trehalose-phosphatase [Anaerolineales bacterium]|nr:trehalose-phosphatase [Anaerolineales bacterium]
MKFRSKSELAKWARESQLLWLFLDYDGTLADFASTPDIIEPNPRVISILEQLVRTSTLRVTILSGRRLGHVRLLLPITGIFLAGTYGIELLTPTNETIHCVEYTEIRPVLETIRLQWEQIIRGRSNFFLEDKGWTLALHARFAADDESEQVITRARQVIGETAPASHFRILGGHKFLEIAPRLASKKDTVAYLLSQYPLPDANLLYIGDDDKDEEAFPVIHAHQGVAVKVLQPSQRSQPTTADFFFESPDETLQWLEDLSY